MTLSPELLAEACLSTRLSDCKNIHCSIGDHPMSTAEPVSVLIERLERHLVGSSLNDGLYTPKKLLTDCLAALSHVQAPAEVVGEPGLVRFAKEMLGCARQGGSMDGGTIQEVAEECGLIRCTKFDPNKHTDHSGDFEEGQDWYVFAGPLAHPTLTPAEAKEAGIRALKAESLLEEVRDKGLIYWQPNTPRGHISKDDILRRIDTILEAGKS